MSQHVSSRNIPLIYQGHGAPHDILTVENYAKWYDLYLVKPDGAVLEVDLYGDMLNGLAPEQGTEADGASSVGDHVWNPLYVERVAEHLNAQVDFVSLDAITGRWVREHLSLYEDGNFPVTLPRNPDLSWEPVAPNLGAVLPKSVVRRARLFDSKDLSTCLSLSQHKDDSFSFTIDKGNASGDASLTTLGDISPRQLRAIAELVLQNKS